MINQQERPVMNVNEGFNQMTKSREKKKMMYNQIFKRKSTVE